MNNYSINYCECNREDVTYFKENTQFICSEPRILLAGMFTILEDEATCNNTCFGGPLIYMMSIFSNSNMQ
jgi:hypothetical protein